MLGEGKTLMKERQEPMIPTAYAHIPHGPLLIFETWGSAGDRLSVSYLPITEDW